MANHTEKVTVRLTEDTLERLDDAIDDDPRFASRSQWFRWLCNAYIEARENTDTSVGELTELSHELEGPR